VYRQHAVKFSQKVWTDVNHFISVIIYHIDSISLPIDFVSDHMLHDHNVNDIPQTI